jgi:bacillithiol biosynthesis cysteine-adding enzyme BshC
MTEPMECTRFALTRLPHSTRLLADYLDEFENLSSFYSHPPRREGVLAAARAVSLASETRAQMAEILAEENERFGLEPAAKLNIERFRNGAVAIVTGQQVGLFSGPAYTFYKALGALRLAHELTESGIEAVPIFWMATEDHDLAEVNQCFWATRAGFERVELPFAPETAGGPVGRIALPEEVTAAVESVCAKLEGPSTPSITAALENSYRPGETLGTAFGRLLARLLGSRGLILLDPMDARVHQLAKPLYLAAIDAKEDLDAGLLERAERLAEGGYHAQVRVTGESTLLFWEKDGKRFPVESRGGKLHAGDGDFTPAEFRAAVDRHPELASANVLLRPVVQDALLGTAAYIGGAAEIAYFAQAQVVYRLLGVPMPAVLSRPGFTIVERPLARLLSKYRLEMTDVFQGRQYLRSLMERESLPTALLEDFADREAKLKDLLAGLREPVTRLDSTLAGALETAEKKMLYQFGKLHEKAGRALGMRSGILDRHEQLLTDLLYPHHGLQERTLCFLPMLAWQGLGLLDALEAEAHADSARHAAMILD